MGVTSWLGTLFEFIGGIFNIIWAVLCLPVYAIIRTNFNIFIKIAELNILSSADMNEIYKRVTMIITIVMSFYVIFNIIKYTISPDTITDKEKGAGNIAKRIIVAILLIAFVPTAFSMAYKIQNRIISTQVIPKVILGQQVWDYSTYGSSFAADTFSAFYRVDREHCGSHCEEAQEHVSDLIESIRQGGSVIHILGTMGGQLGLSVSGHTVPAEAVEFDGLFALIFGCYVIYVIFIYSIDVAVRYIQLLYLQIISPIAIMGYIVPSKDNMFQRWLRQCSTTYLDLFIRISIMYFAMLIIQILGHSLRITNLTTGSQASNVGPIAYKIAETDGSHIGPIVYIFFIMGVLIFVQRAPKLLEELFPKSGAAGIGFGFDWKTRGDPLKKSYNALKKPIAATSGAIASGLNTYKSLRNGKLREALANKDWSTQKKRAANDKLGKKLKFLQNDEFYRGLNTAVSMGKSVIGGGRNAAKSNSIIGAYANRDKAEREDLNLIDDGGTPAGYNLFGLYYDNEKTRYKRFIDSMDDIIKTRKSVGTAAGDTKAMKATMAHIADWNQKGVGDAEKRDNIKKEVEKALRIYAVSDRTTPAKQELAVKAFNDAVREALKDNGFATFNSDGECTGGLDATAYAAITDKFEKEDKNSTEMAILKQEVEESHRHTLAAKDKDGSPYVFKYVKDTGEIAEIEYSDIKDFAKNIGKIEKSASDVKLETQYSAEYKETNANANVPGKKDGEKK